MTIAELTRKLAKATLRTGHMTVRKNGHIRIIRMLDRHVVVDIHARGMDKAELARELEILLLAVTQPFAGLHWGV